MGWCRSSMVGAREDVGSKEEEWRRGKWCNLKRKGKRGSTGWWFCEWLGRKGEGCEYGGRKRGRVEPTRVRGGQVCEKKGRKAEGVANGDGMGRR
ncbi:hypothetical protein GOBAR_AA26714 [Gossypium barbadense]|uniref:Uncharacterized protein n=1 Tax=Gossypium barbadense TaxID=3634 RepID=A0A2P5WS91_GOSBA|nr:hypothetical protein GOBAR_AA26714 [Gossypium barbadense]